MMRTPPPQSPSGEDWYASEQPTRTVMIAELQRIIRRVRVRPIPVILLAAFVTSLIMYRLAHRKPIVQAEVVLALQEGQLSRSRNNIPVTHLREYVSSVLLPDNKLIELIERRDLFRLRKRLGPQFAIEELRSVLDIQIWRNSFMYYAPEDQYSRQRARIGFEVTDSDPDRAFDLARDLAAIAIESASQERQRVAEVLSKQINMLRDATNEKLRRLSEEVLAKEAAIARAMESGKPEIAGVLRIDLAAIVRDRKRSEAMLGEIVASPELLATEIAAAGLDMSLSIVEEHRPERPETSAFVLLLIGVVVGTGALLGSATLLGAFDSRVHDTDDVARLGLPVLGHVPGFAGDNVGSMQARSVERARVPSLRRWRLHQ